MGCDIHMFREVYREGKWECLEETYEEEDWGSDSEGTMTRPEDLGISRNYWLFGLLCDGVRTSWEFSWQPRGIPEDASEAVRADHALWDSDAHSASWLSLPDIREKAAELLILPGQKSAQCFAELADLQNQLDWPTDAAPEDCRIVFWFDN